MPGENQVTSAGYDVGKAIGIEIKSCPSAQGQIHRFLIMMGSYVDAICLKCLFIDIGGDLQILFSEVTTKVLLNCYSVFPIVFLLTLNQRWWQFPLNWYRVLRKQET